MGTLKFEQPGAIHRWALILILLAYLALASAYSLATPPWEAPDEPSHFRYIEHLALYRSLPPPAPPQRGHFWQHGYATSLYEWYQLPLYYIIPAPALAALNRIHPGSLPQTFPPIVPGFPQDTTSLFRHKTPLETEPALRLARSFSIVLGLLSLLATYRLALQTTQGDPWIALTAVGLMAFIPQFTFLSGYVTNDNLVILISALCLLSFTILLNPTRASQTFQVAAAGVVTALALLTKLSLWFLLPVGLLCLLWRWRLHRSVKRWLLESGIFTMIALAPLGMGVAFLPSIRQQLAHAQATMTPRQDYMNWSYILGLWPQTNRSFWGTFGWMNILTPLWISRSLNLVALIGLAGSLLSLGSRQAKATKATLVLFLIVCALVAIGFLRFNLAVRQPQGRLLFPALPAFIVLVAVGWGRLTGKYRAVLGPALIVFTLGVNLVSLFGTLIPAY